MSEVVRVRALVSGRVQGVFYRDSARRRATEVGVAGTARNLADGRVELVLEGERAAVEQVLAWAAEGPPAAVVTGVERHPPEEPLGLEGFRVG